MGAADVQCNWSNEACDRARLLYQDEENLGKLPPWEAERYNAPSRTGCAYLRLFSEDPFGMGGRGPGAHRAATQRGLRRDKGGAALPGDGRFPGWRRPTGQGLGRSAVFPNLAGEEAQAALWRAILAATRADAPDRTRPGRPTSRTSPAAPNGSTRSSLRPSTTRAGLGTDFTVGMPEGQNWAGGRSWTTDGRAFIPNMPTEEVFCAPHRDRGRGPAGSPRSPCPTAAAASRALRSRLQTGRSWTLTPARGRRRSPPS